MGLDRPALQSSRYSRCYLQCRGSTGPCYFFIWHWLGSPAFFSLTAAAAGKAVKIMHEGLSSPCSHVFFVIALATRKVRRRETGGGLGVIAAAVAAPGWGCWRKWTALSSKFDQRLLPLCFCFFFFFSCSTRGFLGHSRKKAKESLLSTRWSQLASDYTCCCFCYLQCCFVFITCLLLLLSSTTI